ncbi:hypothetical protein PISMIDRAFT_682118 [Pisolithus microcarpus 441]|uniref:Uncharacterized protein n=1 Tax=Pisolithus microcarpus 441 TaxID=765257 RepID=A0A0C9ZLH1_9AGAM|nr:hypothetical protein PISMIDRAFT_682118 [Pisolithus microcarpus 441]
MPSRALRAHRLPQRLDYNLVPAPIDISLTQVTEKSPLPAIIVTPSSPSVDTPQFYIAFLDSPKPSLRERILQYSPFQSTFPTKAKTAIVLILLLFIIISHLFFHLASHRPHFAFYKSSDLSSFRSDAHGSDGLSWDLMPFDFQSLWDISSVHEGARDGIVADLSHAIQR